ncbi:hypothetical protein KP806_14735 [Paenibacillus sp. N4]|uniref:glycosyl hydrolase n=1 Tax=Paenibacillus vietnamensis TaxID=2590547 RepID=UPI001CD18AA2|nr:glycosyl hydrolase [Paenibacillus vietnamensis]MCA0756308.1 hypothetical protein [Paenibacillus vietnamensis]
MSDLSKLRKQFAEPPAEARSAPFWAWNDKLDKDELIRQIEGMKEQGIGGFFMHARDGLETGYLGPEWMEAVEASVRKADELGMEAWLYDEDRWPSGTAGGKVPSLGDEYRSKGLTVEVLQDDGLGTAAAPYRAGARTVALFKAHIDGMQLYHCERLPHTVPVTSLEAGEALLVFRVEVSAPSEWFNGQAPPDSMNAAAVRKFIDETYEVYKAKVGDRFGSTIKGVFTDEPSVNDRHCKFTDGRGWVPWTYSLPDFFRSRRGYELLDEVPHLFFNSGRSSWVRHDYWRTVSELFTEAFSKQLYDWCGENGLAFTGHYLQEDKLGLGTRVGGAIMPHYRYQHIPGIDMLTEATDEHMTVKQCTSVANQYGRKRVLSETYGCAGWEFTFEGQKWIGDWQYALGVNFRSQHLSLYSIKGCRKRDYPPVFNYNTSWWKYNHVVENYFARLGAVLAEGQAVRDILVLHPVTTAWSMLGSDPYGMPNRGRDRDIPGINRYGDEFNRFLRALLGAHHDFDLGDETILSEIGEVNTGKLVVGRAAYKAVVIPSITTMLRTTYELLLQYVEAGGRIAALQPLPTMLEGRPSDEITKLTKHPGFTPVSDTSNVIDWLDHHSGLARQVSIRGRSGTEESGLLGMLREHEGCRSLFIVNNDRDRAHDVLIETAAAGSVEEWEALTGKTNKVESWLCEGRLQFRASFGPAGSRLYLIDETAAPAAQAPPAEPIGFNDNDLYAAFGPGFRFSRTMPNALTLDKCRFRIRSGSWSAPMEVWQAQRLIREELGMRQVFYNGMTQRYKWIGEGHPNDGTAVEFRFAFQVDELPGNDVSLALEGAERFRIRCNGEDLASSVEGWYMDRSIGCVKLGGLRMGGNELIVSCRYTNDMEMEDIYLLGDFGVSPERRIIEEPKRLHAGDWCLQGYFHYCGSIIYHLDYRHRPEPDYRMLLALGEVSAVTAEVRVNGAAAGHIPWRAADGLDITGFLAEGGNRLEIEVMGSPRNVFGPFHGARGKTRVTSWSSFRTEGKEYTPDYITHPYGIMGQIKLIRSR